MDNSDGQYSGFRDNIPYLLLLLLLHPIIRGLLQYGRPQPEGLRPISKSDGLPALSRLGESRMVGRVKFDLCFGMIYILALHGISAFKVFLILYINFQLATKLPKSQIPAAAWIFNIGILFANELCHGYPLAAAVGNVFPPSIAPDGSAGKGPLLVWATYLDGFGGLIPRWEVLFKITILRLISFDLDVYWGLQVSSGSPLEVRRVYQILTDCVLMRPRRSNSIHQISRSEIVSAYRLSVETSRSATTSLMCCIPPYTLRAQS